MQRKTCKKCGINKEVLSFEVDTGTKDGYKDNCYQCVHNKNRTNEHGRTERFYKLYLYWKPKLKELNKICSYFKLGDISKI